MIKTEQATSTQNHTSQKQRTPPPQAQAPPSAAVRLLRLIYSLCLARFFAAPRIPSAPALARPDFTPPNDLRAPKLERVRPAGDDAFPCAAARCAPTFAMTREREMRGLRATSAFGFGGSTAGRGILDGELSSTLEKSVEAAAPRDGWYAGEDGAPGLPKPSNG